jgi:hypothetical protein
MLIIFFCQNKMHRPINISLKIKSLIFQKWLFVRDRVRL